MKVAVMTQKNKIELLEESIPEPVHDGEVQIKVDYTGICGSDVHLFETANCALGPITQPLVLGHECAGTVTKLGPNVKTLHVGDRVAVEPGIPCFHCEHCKEGRYNLCDNVRFYAAPPTYDGCFQEYIVHSEAMCYKLPNSISTLEGAMFEPLSVGIHAIKRSGLLPGQTVCILGSGCIGLMDMLVAKHYGASKVIVCDVLDNRLEMAKELGATHVFNSRDEGYISKVRELTNGGADVVIDAAGAQVTIFQTGLLVKKGGTVHLMAYPKEMQGTIPINKMINAELNITTSFRYRNTYPTAIEMTLNGLPIRKIVSRIFPLDHISEAFDTAINKKQEVTKCVIKINPDLPDLV